MTSHAPGRRFCVPAMAAVIAAALSLAGAPRTAQAGNCSVPGPGPAATCSGTQADTVTVQAGSLALAFANPSNSFGTLNIGQTSAAVAAGTVTETDTLGDGSAWNTTVAASALAAGTPTPINQSNLTLNSAASTFACGAGGCSGAGGAAAGVNGAFSGAVAQTIMNAPLGTTQGEFVQSGITYTLFVPWATIATVTAYTGTLTYTITG